jgi:para-nitrobenzyl esterase
MNAQVATSAGRVQGRQQQAGRSNTTVEVFRGIPYAAAPVGPWRFAAPQPLPGWSGVRSATAPAPSPMQSPASLFSGVIPGNKVGEVSEDCLSVDIWRPLGKGDDLPVLVWIYGGAFLTGGSNIETYDGSRLAADHDVVVVSVNYRLGALGFLWLEDDRVASNRGLRDQLAALGWIRDNIAAFGGDPGNVTVFGESAGAGSLLHLMTAPGATELVKRCILQSPGVDLTLRADEATRVTETLLGHLGIGAGDLDRAGDFDRLWELPPEAIVDAQEKTVLDVLTTISSMPFHPVVDGSFLTDTPSVAFANGAAAEIDLLVTWTTDEMRLYPNPVADQVGIEGITGWVQHYLTGRVGHDSGRERARALVAFYEDLMRGGRRSTTADIYAAIQTDGMMRLPTRRIAEAHAAAAGGGATLVAEFAWGARVEGEVWERGAFHAVDLPFTFGTLDRCGWSEFLGAGAAAEQLSEWHLAAWAGFARGGDPGAAVTGAGAPGPWPRYGLDRRATMILNEACSVVDDPLGEIDRAWDGLWSPECRTASMGVE